MKYHRNARLNLKRNATASALFVLIMLSVIPAVSNGFFIPVIQKAAGQGEDPFPVMGNETLTPSQQKAREQLLSQGAFRSRR